jgi:hypothetical protein
MRHQWSKTHRQDSPVMGLTRCTSHRYKCRESGKGDALDNVCNVGNSPRFSLHTLACLGEANEVSGRTMRTPVAGRQCIRFPFANPL